MQAVEPRVEIGCGAIEFATGRGAPKVDRGQLIMMASAMSGLVAMFMNGLGIIRVQVVTGILMAVVSLWARIHFAPIYGITGVVMSNALSQILLVSLPSWWILWRVMHADADTARTAR